LTTVVTCPDHRRILYVICHALIRTHLGRGRFRPTIRTTNLPQTHRPGVTAWSRYCCYRNLFGRPNRLSHRPGHRCYHRHCAGCRLRYRAGHRARPSTTHRSTTRTGWSDRTVLCTNLFRVFISDLHRCLGADYAVSRDTTSFRRTSTDLDDHRIWPYSICSWSVGQKNLIAGLLAA